MVGADVVCLQEVAPNSFEEDFKFMEGLGYDGVEIFKKGRFRPATFWKKSRVELAAPPVHKDRTLLTCFRKKDDGGTEQQQPPDSSKKPSQQKEVKKSWYVLNCHLQAGKNAQRRVRQINEGVRAVLTLARKQKEKDPEKSVRLIVCGDFNGGKECGAVRYLEDGYVDEKFIEDGDPATSSRKTMPLSAPMTDAATTIERDPPATLVVPELISQMVEGEEGTAYADPKLSKDVIRRLASIFERLATHDVGASDGSKRMNIQDVENWLTIINQQVGRGSEFREAAKLMGWKDPKPEASFEERKTRIVLPPTGVLSLDDFIEVYEEELRNGKFWGIAHDLAVLGEPLPDAGVFQARFDRMYCSSAIKPVAIVDTTCSKPCPNHQEPSDHLPVAAVFTDL